MHHRALGSHTRLWKQRECAYRWIACCSCIPLEKAQLYLEFTSQFTVMSRHSGCFCHDFWVMCPGRMKSLHQGNGAHPQLSSIKSDPPGLLLSLPFCNYSPYFAEEAGILVIGDGIFFLCCSHCLNDSNEQVGVDEHIHIVQPVPRTSFCKTKTMHSNLLISACFLHLETAIPVYS